MNVKFWLIILLISSIIISCMPEKDIKNDSGVILIQKADSIIKNINVAAKEIEFAKFKMAKHNESAQYNEVIKDFIITEIYRGEYEELVKKSSIIAEIKGMYRKIYVSEINYIIDSSFTRPEVSFHFTERKLYMDMNYEIKNLERIYNNLLNENPYQFTNAQSITIFTDDLNKIVTRRINICIDKNKRSQRDK